MCLSVSQFELKLWLTSDTFTKETRWKRSCEIRSRFNELVYQMFNITRATLRKLCCDIPYKDYKANSVPRIILIKRVKTPIKMSTLLNHTTSQMGYSEMKDQDCEMKTYRKNLTHCESNTSTTLLNLFAKFWSQPINIFTVAIHSLLY